MRFITLLCAVVVVLLTLASPAAASNGLNLIGFGAESYIMGGADLAVARDTTATNTNPAGLGQIDNRRLDLYVSLGFQLNDFRHQDTFGNDALVSSPPAKLANFGYGHRLGRRTTIGVGLFAQGGSGIEHDALETAFGTRDELSIAFLVARLTPAVAVQVTDALSVGGSLLVTYASFEQKFFPNTSYADPDPTRSFFGSELKDLETVNVGAKLGLLYRVNDRIRVGMAYTSPVPLKFDEGQMIANMSAVGLGNVTYRSVMAEGIDQPQELGIGVAIEPTDRWLLSGEVNWIDWSGAVKRTTLEASDPDNAAAPATVRVTQDQNWRDQYVLALGLAYAPTERAMIRAGYNYGRNPVPAETMNPLLAPIGEHHVTFGGGYQMGAKWRIDGGVEYAFKNEVTYTNPNLPFGPDAKESYEFTSVHMALSRAW
ncbi:MAG: outer membrane protein transport protein [Nitrospirota bacterium]